MIKVQSLNPNRSPTANSQMNTKGLCLENIPLMIKLMRMTFDGNRQE